MTIFEQILAGLQQKFSGVDTATLARIATKKAEGITDETKVTFRPLSDEEISAYVACGESMDKAGAYAIQGRGTLLASRIEGCYFNVVGLPLFLLSRMFASMGAPLSAQWGNE